MFIKASFAIAKIWKGFPGGSDGKETACSAGDLGLMPGLQEDPLEKERATHSSVLAWRIPWTDEPGDHSLWSERLGHEILQPFLTFE